MGALTSGTATVGNGQHGPCNLAAVVWCSSEWPVCSGQVRNGGLYIVARSGMVACM